MTVFSIVGQKIETNEMWLRKYLVQIAIVGRCIRYKFFMWNCSYCPSIVDFCVKISDEPFLLHSGHRYNHFLFNFCRSILIPTLVYNFSYKKSYAFQFLTNYLTSQYLAYFQIYNFDAIFKTNLNINSFLTLYILNKSSKVFSLLELPTKINYELYWKKVHDFETAETFARCKQD